jgi:hypothetical protein
VFVPLLNLPFIVAKFAFFASGEYAEPQSLDYANDTFYFDFGVFLLHQGQPFL